MEAAWRLLELPTRFMSHSVIRLPVHLPGHQYIQFEEGHEEKAVNSSQHITKLTAFFELNRRDETARQYTYPEIPKHFTWHQKNRCWQKRQRGMEKTVTRMYSVSPKDVERFFLKLLLQHTKGATSFEALKIVNGELCTTFYEAAYKLGFITSPKHIEEMMDECCATMMPKSLRKFFAYLLLTCDNLDVKGLWNKYKEAICDKSPEHEVLIDIERLLNSEDKSLLMFGFEEANLDTSFNEFEDDQSVNEHTLKAQEMRLKQNKDQSEAFLDITRRLENGAQKLFFLDGPGGTGKTFLYKSLYHHWRSMSKNVVSIAWTGIAAILLPNGRTAHRFFKLPINLPGSHDDITPIFLTKRAKKNLTEVDIIIWDEVSMIPGTALRMIDVTLRDLMKSDELFGGKCFLFGGDFRQILPIVKRARRAEIVKACVTNLGFWHSMKHYTLKINMRINEKHFNEWLLEIGNGNIDMLRVPDDILCENVIEAVYNNDFSEDSLSQCVLLAALNDQVNMLNEQILKKFPGQIIEIIGHDIATSSDSDAIDGDDVMLRFQPEYLNKLNISGLPQFKLKLKIGAVVMLIRNICIADGLCNGTRLIVRRITTKILYCTILTGNKVGDCVTIPKITLNTKDKTDLPFILHRTQFPVRLAFAMTINKAQGQSFNRVGIYLNQKSPIFSHGQLYVALSRCRSLSGLKIKITGQTCEEQKNHIHNIVYSEVFNRNTAQRS